MRQLLLTICLSLAAVPLHASTARACINDRTTVQTESEFKKHYEFKSNYQEQQRPYHEQPSTSWQSVVATGSGSGLLLATIGLVTLNVRRSWRGQMEAVAQA